MAALRTRMRMPPRVHWDFIIEVILLVVVVGAVLLLAWIALSTFVTVPAVPTTNVTLAGNALMEQRRGEWNVNLSALSPAQRALYQQRVGEWSTKTVIPAAQFDLNIRRVNEARALGVR